MRNNTIDIAKGIGILLVVAGHNDFIIPLKETMNVIYSFHMPLFFLLSGIYLNSKGHIISFITSKFDYILKPYLAVLLVLGLGKISLGVLPWSHLHGIAYGTSQTIVWQTLWFLPNLFTAVLFSFLLIKLTRGEDGASKHLLGLLALLMLIVGSQVLDIYYKVDRRGLPWSLDVSLLSTGYVLLGYYLRESVKAIKFSAGGFILAAIIFAFFHINFDVAMDLNRREFGQLFIAIPQSLLGIYLTLSASELLSRHGNKLLCYIGASSLFIYIFHQYIQNKIYAALLPVAKSGLISATVSLTASVIASLLLMECIKRNKHASRLLLPMRRAKVSGDTEGNKSIAAQA